MLQGICKWCDRLPIEHFTGTSSGRVFFSEMDAMEKGKVIEEKLDQLIGKTKRKKREDSFSVAYFKPHGSETKSTFEVVRTDWIRHDKRSQKHFCFYTENEKHLKELMSTHPHPLKVTEMTEKEGKEYELVRAPKASETGPCKLTFLLCCNQSTV
jgi:hypothetical protein